MQIAIFGSPKKLVSIQNSGLNPELQVSFFEQDTQQKVDMGNFQVIMDLDLDDSPENISYYGNLSSDTWLIASALKIQLAEIISSSPENIKAKAIGINSLNGFLESPLKEISLFNAQLSNELPELMNSLHWKYQLIHDRVGMVRPRVLFMIINEAFYTLQEGTASQIDIDTAMKLGTNYPKGPFEWLDEIGVKDLYETLLAIQKDTAEDRYKICPLLKTQYILSFQNQ